MTPEEYLREVRRTARSDHPPDKQLAVLALGLTGEAGEVADLIKKVVGHGHPLDAECRLRLKKELGDNLWYLVALLDYLGLTLEDAMTENVAKLRARYPDGFSTERSLNRGET